MSEKDTKVDLCGTCGKPSIFRREGRQVRVGRGEPFTTEIWVCIICNQGGLLS